MPTPILIDTDMGVDDAVAIALAFMARDLDVRGIVSVGGNVDLQQATANVGRLLRAVEPARRPLVGRGLDQSGDGLTNATHVFGRDGFGECDRKADEGLEPVDFRDVYRAALDDPAGPATIVAIGPLTNVAVMLREDATRIRTVPRIVVMGGALWCKGNVRDVVEFNFHRDPAAAADVLSAGLPVTLVPLDVTRFVTLDASHVARLAASGTRVGEFLAEIIPYVMEHSTEAGKGRFVVHDALAVGALLWPQLFLKTGVAVEVSRDGTIAGQTRPRISAMQDQRIDVLTAVNAADFLENMLETLCQEEFVV
ncbi:MAG: nucleoside hydrolase [Phycisphaerae bacterium]|nr:nucleoside hydrolase [Phycisphaerae bacterium]